LEALGGVAFVVYCAPLARRPAFRRGRTGSEGVVGLLLVIAVNDASPRSTKSISIVLGRGLSQLCAIWMTKLPDLLLESAESWVVDQA
jgi:hypothetical protein